MKKAGSVGDLSRVHPRIKLLLVSVATVIGVVGASAGMAAAHSTATSSQHTVGFSTDVAGDVFTGQVSSAKAACERGRSIVIYRVLGDSSVPDEKVATATTNESSVWTQGVGHASAGEYYAVAARKVIRSAGHKHVCKAARSETITASPALEGLWFDPDTVPVGQKSTGTVSLSVSTGEDLTVALESSDASVAQVPATVTVSAGQDRASFQVTGLDDGSTTVRASLDGTSFEQTLTVVPVGSQ